MSTLEREIMEKFHQLQPDAQQRIRALIEQETALAVEPADAAVFDYDAWFRDVEALQASISARLGEGETVGALSLLDELREEES